MDVEQLVGLVVFGGGTYLNIVPEWQRHVWKQELLAHARLISL